MCLLLETIKIAQGKALNLPLHEARMQRARSSLFNVQEPIVLEEWISLPPEMNDSVFRCRVIYDTAIREIQYLPHHPVGINTLLLTMADTLEYQHKYVDRYALNALVQKDKADDVLIVKNGLITDTSMANIVFKSGEECFTPSTPLLRGTQREWLLEKGILQETEIAAADLDRFSHFKLINALLEFDAPWLPVENIFRP